LRNSSGENGAGCCVVGALRLINTPNTRKTVDWPEENQELLSWEETLPSEQSSCFTLAPGSYSVPLAEPEVYSPDLDYVTPDSIRDSETNPFWASVTGDDDTRCVSTLYATNRTNLSTSVVCDGAAHRVTSLDVQPLELEERSRSRSLSTRGPLENATRSLLEAGMVDIGSDYVSKLPFSLTSENHIRSLPNLYVVLSGALQSGTVPLNNIQDTINPTT